MDKRGYIDVESPPDPIANHNGAIRKKLKVAEKLSFENDGNSMNMCNNNDSLYPGFDVNDLCFDDDLDLLNVRYINLFKFQQVICENFSVSKKTRWISTHSSAAALTTLRSTEGHLRRSCMCKKRSPQLQPSAASRECGMKLMSRKATWCP